MKVLVTGRGGQLAWELEQTQSSDVDFTSLSSKELDITKVDDVMAVVSDIKPSIIINAAAYTAVDKAESDSEVAYAVNELGSENLAKACKAVGARLIHVSTDFVFDGTKPAPYQVDDAPNPINVYGDSKLQGDLKISQILGDNAVIVRTAWVYSAHGNNFVKTMLRLMAEKEQLGVVYDQVGSPTWAKGLANTIWKLISQPESTKGPSSQAKLLHWTDAGIASWYDFAVAIQRLAIDKGLLSKSIPIRPIPASSYPTPARRPGFSVLDKQLTEGFANVQTEHWQQQLSLMLDDYKNTIV